MMGEPLIGCLLHVPTGGTEPAARACAPSARSPTLCPRSQTSEGMGFSFLKNLSIQLILWVTPATGCVLGRRR